MAMMDHPNIARVLDGGLTPGGQPFFIAVFQVFSGRKSNGPPPACKTSGLAILDAGQETAPTVEQNQESSLTDETG